MNWAVLASTRTRDYCFDVPIAALIWKERIRFQPFIFLVGTEQQWREDPRASVALQFINNMNLTHCFLESIQGVEDSTVAQNVRQHATVLPVFHDEDLVLLSDADLWVLNTKYIDQMDLTKRFNLIYANGDHYQSFPTCHVVARAKEWRSLMGLKADCRAEQALQDSFNNWLFPRLAEKQTMSEKGWIAWNMDQWRTSELLKSQPWFPAEVKMIERIGHTPADRLDRAAWPHDPGYSIESYADAHIPHAPDQPEMWPLIRPIIQQTLSKSLADEIDKYRDAFFASYM